MAQFEPGMYWMETPKLGTNSSKNGTPFLFLQGRITHIAVGGETKPVLLPTERTIREFLSDAAFPYAIARLGSIGFNGDFANPAFSGEHAKGVWVECSLEMWTDDTGTSKQVERWQLAGGGGSGVKHEQFDSDTLRRLTAMRENHERNSKTAPSGPSGPSIPF